MCSFLRLILEISEAYLKVNWIYLTLLSDIYLIKIVSAVFVTKLFRWRENYHWESRLFSWDNFICCHFLIKQILFHNQKSFDSKWAKMYSYWILFDSQRILESQILAIVTSKPLLKSSKFTPVLSIFSHTEN